MVEAVLTDSGAELPVCAWTTGEYGISDVYLGVLARLGAGGVQQIVEADLTEGERQALVDAAAAVREKVAEMDQIEL
jgi:malate dehydrogenase